MATRQSSGSPWPTPTHQSYSSKSKRKWDPKEDPPPNPHRPSPRQAANDASVTSNNCGIQPNSVISCYPAADSNVVQDIPTRFVWNNRLPQFSQSNLVDIFLYHGDTDEQVDFWQGLNYPFGHLPVTPNDTWWGSKGPLIQPGKNQTQNFFFVMVASGANAISGVSQATFTATQTTLPTSILSSLSVSSVSASAAAASSSSLASLSSASAKQSATASPGALQNSSDSASNFPHWAIALLSVFGFLALVSVLFVFWLLIPSLRRRHGDKSGLKHRNSIGSQSPMMANISGAPHSPTTVNHEHHSTESHLGPLPTISNRANIVSSDGASTISRADSAGGPFSIADAANMAAAYRNVMRKPDFTDRPMEEGEGPDQPEKDVMGRELAEEGRDIRSVSSSRGVKVETLSDDGERLH